METNYRGAMSRRQFLKKGALGAAALGCASLWPRTAGAWASGPAGNRITLSDGWLFGGKFTEEATASAFDDAGFVRVTVPHCVSKLSWQKWNQNDWEDVWIYRRHFSLLEEFRDKRMFLHFDGVMVGTTPTVNGHAFSEYLGGYLPSRYEITSALKDGDNVLAVKVDSRWLNVPPEGSPKGPSRIDYLEPGGIYRPVHLEAVPQIFISDVFAKPANVLDPSRRVDVTCALDLGKAPDGGLTVVVELKDGERVLARDQRSVVDVLAPGTSSINLTLSNLGNIKLWHVDSPQLYYVAATLLADGKPVHEYRTRIGFREARFEVDGFFLNGERFRFFGLDRHELFPYVGGAMPSRVMRRDAEILRHELNCNMVRCSHYPQSEAFLEACDELGLMVWEETPGWGYLGDAPWKDLVVRDVGEMVRRDRNHASIIIWGVRVNESADDVELYRRTTDLAKSLDGSRPCSGSMTSLNRPNWHEDVFAMDDYHATPKGTVGIYAPLPNVPYMLAETVGQFNYAKRKDFDAKYRRTGDPRMQMQQALRHAQAHNKALDYPRFCGVIAWCAFEYGSLVNSYNKVKNPGVVDVFRIPKLGASFYLAQTGPNAKPVIEPNFYWDFGPATPNGPGKNVAVFSNCDRLEFYIEDKHHATATPDTTNYPHLKHPPFFVDLEMDGSGHPELRIVGFMNDKEVVRRSFSSDPARDVFLLKADDAQIKGDGVDATRLMFGRVDAHGALRPFTSGQVDFVVDGPGIVVGDNPFDLAEAGGMGAVWIKSQPRSFGHIKITARHSDLGSSSVKIKLASV